MNTTTPDAAAIVIPLVCTFSILALTLVWALAGHRPARPRRRVVGRAATPYWYSPTGRQDERGITAVLAAAAIRTIPRPDAAPAGRHTRPQVATEGTV